MLNTQNNIPHDLDEIKSFINSLRPQTRPAPDVSAPANDDSPYAAMPQVHSPQSLDPSVNVASTGGAVPARLAIEGRNNVFAAYGAVVKIAKHIHPVWVILGMVLFGIYSFMCMPIGGALADEFAAQVHAVAQCEGVTANQVHREMKKKYDYSKYSKMSHFDYYRAMHRLNSRKCG